MDKTSFCEPGNREVQEVGQEFSTGPLTEYEIALIECAMVRCGVPRSYRFIFWNEAGCPSLNERNKDIIASIVARLGWDKE